MDCALLSFLTHTEDHAYIIDSGKSCGYESDRITRVNELIIEQNSFVFCSFFQDIEQFLPILDKESGVKIINVWHGMPLRTIGFDDFYEKEFSFIKGVDGYQEFIEHFVVSQKYVSIFEKGFKTYENKVHCIGNIRNNAQIVNYGLRGFDNKIALFAPSANNFKAFLSVSEQLNLEISDEELNYFLRDEGIVLLYKEHPGTLNPVPMKLYTNLIKINDVDMKNFGVQIGNLIQDIDVFITDFSSLIVDFLCRNKPVITILPKYDAFKKRAFIIAPDVLYGEKFSCEESFIALLKNKIELSKSDPHTRMLQDSLSLTTVDAGYEFVKRLQLIAMS